MSKRIAYENPRACPNCLSVSVVLPAGNAVHPDARVCVQCDHSWNLTIYDVPPECVLVQMPDSSIGVMYQSKIPITGYKTRRQAELFAWANYGILDAPSASSGRWESAAKRSRDAWLRSQDDIVKGLRAQMALLDLVMTAGITVANGHLFVSAEYAGTVDDATAKAIEDLRREALSP